MAQLAGMADGTTQSDYANARVDASSGALVETDPWSSGQTFKALMQKYNENWSEFASDNPAMAKLGENGKVPAGHTIAIRANHFTAYAHNPYKGAVNGFPPPTSIGAPPKLPIGGAPIAAPPAAPTDPTAGTDPTLGGDPTDPGADPTDPTDTSGTDPTLGGDPTDPGADPTDPTDPTAGTGTDPSTLGGSPAAPTDPTAPTGGTDPATLGGTPAAPTDPTAGTDPTLGGDPTDPIDPTAGGDPTLGGDPTDGTDGTDGNSTDGTGTDASTLGASPSDDSDQTSTDGTDTDASTLGASPTDNTDQTSTDGTGTDASTLGTSPSPTGQSPSNNANEREFEVAISHSRARGAVVGIRSAIANLTTRATGFRSTPAKDSRESHTLASTITEPRISSMPQLPSLPTAVDQTYTVAPGNTMSEIAQTHGISLASLEAANPNLKDPNLIFPGQIIHMPSNSTASPISSGSPAGQSGSSGDGSSFPTRSTYPPPPGDTLPSSSQPHGPATGSAGGGSITGGASPFGSGAISPEHKSPQPGNSAKKPGGTSTTPL